MLEQQVLASLKEAPASGGALIERLDLEEPVVLVYGALHNLAARGAIVEVASGPGERVWALAGEQSPVRAREPGLPASFALDEEQIGRLDAAVGRATLGLPQHYFEELRRALMSRSDRRGALRIADLGPPALAHRFLRRVERGGRVRLRLRSPARWVWRVAVLAALLVCVRLFAVGVYTVPPQSISMAPALIPAVEGGDRLVLANLLAKEPARGEIWLTAVLGADISYVKRVMGLGGESLEIKQGDLFVNGKRLVKERALLERVGVELAWSGHGDLQAQAGFLLPDGRLNPPDGPCRDVMVSGQVRFKAREGRLSLIIEEQGAPAHALVLGVGGFGAVNGVEQVKGAAFFLTDGNVHEFWMTNADHVVRMEIDGHEVCRAEVRRPGLTSVVRISFDPETVAVSGLKAARDLIYTGQGRWKVPLGSVFLLGDNSANSRDSRHLGPIARSMLIGRLFAVVWPPSRARWIR